MNWTILGIAGVAVILLLLFAGRKPHRYRHKNIGFINEFIQSLAVCGEGAILVVEEEGSDRFIQFRKGRDLGDSIQEVVLGFPRTSWSERFFDRVRDTLQGSGFAPGLVTREAANGARMEFLELNIRGTVWEIGEEAEVVASCVASAMDLDAGSQFTFFIDGVRDIDIWRRANKRVWQEHVDSDHLLTRWHARRQLRKLEQEI